MVDAHCCVRDEGGFTVHWLLRFIGLGLYIMSRVCQPHAHSFHRSFRGSSFLSRKLSRKLPWDLFLKASVEENYYLLFLIYYLLPQLPWKQIYFHGSFRGSFCGSNYRGSNFRGSFLKKLPWKLPKKTSVQVTSTKAFIASMEDFINFHLKCR